MQVTFLGTGAPLAPDRAGPALLVEAEGCRPLLLDAGGGFETTRALQRLGRDFGTLRDVVVTHRHGDHIGGAMALWLAVRPLRFLGPPDALAGVKSLLAITYPHLADGLGLHADYLPVGPGEAVEAGGFELRFYEVAHRVPTLAVRVTRAGRSLAYSADSRPCEGLEACAAGADLFVCDALCAEADGAEAARRARELMHPTAAEAAALATRAGARGLALLHLSRFADPARVRAEAAAGFAGPVHVPNDGDRLPV